MSPTPPDVPKQDLSAVLPQIQTGDIFVFHCEALESRAIDLITDSWFSHAAMAIVHPGTGQRLIWQTDPGAIVEDPATHTSHTGAQLGDLAEAVHQTAKTWGDQPYWRALRWTRPADFDSVVSAAISALEKTPYPSDLAMVLDYLLGRADVANTDGTMFCSQLIAATYQRIGLLSDAHPSDHYLPKDFSSEVGAELSLEAGAELAVEVEVML